MKNYYKNLQENDLQIKNPSRCKSIELRVSEEGNNIGDINDESNIKIHKSKEKENQNIKEESEVFSSHDSFYNSNNNNANQN